MSDNVPSQPHLVQSLTTSTTATKRMFPRFVERPRELQRQVPTYAASPDGKPSWTNDFLWLLDLHKGYGIFSLGEWLFSVISDKSRDYDEETPTEEDSQLKRIAAP